MRLFVALLLEEEVREGIYRATSPLREAGLPVRWTDEANLHLTLKFLGESLPAPVAAIEDAIADAAAKTQPFELELRGMGAFPSLRNPRVLWLGAEASPPLRCLKQDLEWALSPLGFVRETRAFQPHLTIGRARSDARAGDFRKLEELIHKLDYVARTPVTEVHLVRSHLQPGGAKYERIATLPLG